MTKNFTINGNRILILLLFALLPFTNVFSQLECPANINATATAGAGGCAATLTVIANDLGGCNVANTFTNDSPYAMDNNSLDASGDYPVGTSTVTFTSCGGTFSCAMDVIVESPAPICVTQDITVFLDGQGMASYSASDIDGGSSDPCGGNLGLSASPLSFSCLDIGVNSVNFSALNDNNAMCMTSASVTVLDTVAPLFSGLSTIVYLDEMGMATVDSAAVDGGSSDNCGAYTLTLANNVVTCDSIATGALVDVILTDPSGNVTEVQHPVTVLDTIPPVVEDVEDILIVLDPSECLGPVSYEIPTPTENCDAPVSLTQNFNTTIIDNSVSCPVGDMVHYYRVFDLSNHVLDINVDHVTIGVFNSFNSPLVEVKIHELNGDFVLANLTEVASNSMVLGDLSLEFVDFPISYTLTNKVYVIEIIAPNLTDNGFIVATNSLGESEPSYYSSINCGVPEPVTIESIGFANLAVLMTLETSNSFTIEQTEGIATDSIFPIGITTNTFVYTDGSGNTTELSFDVEVEGFPVTALSCLTDLNLSIDSETCVSSLTPEMVLTTDQIGCPDDCIIRILTEDDIELPNVFTSMDIGSSFKYEVSCGGNTCWGYVHVEDKTPPQIMCSNDTITCGELVAFPFPEVDENCTNVSFTILNETTEDVSCDDALLSHIVTRELIAVDDAGNESNICSQELSIMKFDIGTVVAPVNALVPIECGSVYPTDDLGRPDVSFYGGPTLNGVDLIQNQALVCNLFVDFVDMTIPTGVNSFSIVRTFNATHWSCGQDTTAQYVQVFEIGDNLGPVIDCPGDLTFTANPLDCGSSLELPALNVEDICGGVQSVSVQYEGGFIDGNGGLANLPLGYSSVTYTAVDLADNINTCTFNVNVIDDANPIAICDQFTTITLTNEGTAIVDAELFDDGSFDACGDVVIEVRRMNPSCDSDDFFFDESITFCCEDEGTEQMVVLRITDEAGNINKCMVTAEIQDKTPPVLVQGLPDITLACDFPFNTDDTEQFGTIQTNPDDVEEIILTSDIVEFSGPAFDGLVLGGCLELTSDEFSFENLNSCGQGTATRIITFSNSNGQSVTDVQFITFENPDPFDEDDVTFPADITLFNICDLNDIPVSMPVFTEDVCDQVGIDIEDQIIDNSNGSESCVKVLRKFTLIDWCQTNSNTFDLIEGQQVIEIFNIVAPEITSDCNDVSICSFDNDCGDAFIELNLTATDDCTTEDFLNYSYMIDAFSDGSIDITGSTSSASGAYPVGIHTIYWNVNDACGNEDICSYTFEIQNCKTPTPYCLDNLTAGLTPWDTDGDGEPDTEKIVVTPDFFDAGSFHACGTPVQLSFSEDVNDVERIFDCEDIGEQPIQLWVTDVNGNQDFCITTLDVQDNNDVDFCPDMLVFNITGTVKTADNVNLPDVQASLGLPDLLDNTDENGFYSFSEIPQGNDYNLTMSNNYNHAEGITVSDIILIQKHILGLDPLDSPYKLIAADVDKSTKVNGQDIIQIRKLLLGHYDEFPLNESWMFLDADTDFMDPANPWFNEMNDYVAINNLSSDVVVDFVGMKVGDVNETAMNGLAHGIDTRNDKTVTFEMNAVQLNAGEYATIALTQTTDVAVEGLQLGLTYDVEVMEIVEVKIGNVLATESQLKMQDGSMSILLDQNEIEQGITFYVNAKRDMNSSTIMINDEVFMNMAYAQSEGEMKVALREDIVLEETEFDFALTQNEPNPWMNSTNISFTSPSTVQGIFRVMDTNGKVILDRTIDCTKGENTFVLYNSELPSSGIYYYEVTIDSVRQMKKMILIK